MTFIPGWPEIHAKGEYVLIQDIPALEEGPLREVLFPQGIQSLLAFPLFENSKCVGFIGFDAVKTKHHYTSNEISILEIFSKLLSNITDRKHKEYELEVEKNRFTLAVEGSQDGIWDWNIETNELLFGERFEIMLGYTPGTLEHNASTWFNLLHPDDKEMASKTVYEYLNAKGKGLYECTFRLKAGDGSWKWILGRGKAEFDKSAKALRLVGFNTDITEKKLLEQELKKKL
jgi:PAS domain S-box-containing protein